MRFVHKRDSTQVSKVRKSSGEYVWAALEGHGRQVACLWGRREAGLPVTVSVLGFVLPFFKRRSFHISCSACHTASALKGLLIHSGNHSFKRYQFLFPVSHLPLTVVTWTICLQPLVFRLRKSFTVPRSPKPSDLFSPNTYKRWECCDLWSIWDFLWDIESKEVI